jgi:Mlc titration factor MtfA (ptsG expression regulator)
MSASSRGGGDGVFGLRERRRAKLQQMPLSQEWAAILERDVPLYRRLSPEDRLELHGHLRVFLAEKRFEGADGFEVTDEVRLAIAAQACILLLHRKTGYFPTLSSIIVYPGEYVARLRDQDENGVVWEEDEERAGESWSLGSLVLSWRDILEDRDDLDTDLNVVLHEFAHQLDAEKGDMNGLPRIDDAALREEWSQALLDAYEDLARQADAGRNTALDPYGAEDPSEFFAVATETFFQQPRRLQAVYPLVYAALSRYFAQDPLHWPGETAVGGRRHRRAS